MRDASSASKKTHVCDPINTELTLSQLRRSWNLAWNRQRGAPWYCVDETHGAGEIGLFMLTSQFVDFRLPTLQVE